jgi:hypothetical protein
MKRLPITILDSNKKPKIIYIKNFLHHFLQTNNNTTLLLDNEEELDDEPKPHGVAWRNVYRNKPGEEEWRTSPMYKYLTKPTFRQKGHRDYRLFIRRFGLNFEAFLHLVDILQNDVTFPKTVEVTPMKYAPAPLKLKVLCSLKILRRNEVLDSISEISGISERTIRTFFEIFVKYVGTTLYKTYVVDAASTPQNVARRLEWAAILGLHGCVGVEDGVHVPLLNCPANYKARAMDKDKQTSVVFGVVTDFALNVLGCTRLFLGGENDKTVALDCTLNKMVSSHMPPYDITFQQHDKNGLVSTNNDLWFEVDGGYTQKTFLITGRANSIEDGEVRHSRWHESTRKAVERTFGALEKIFAITKGIRFRSLELVENIFFSCLALYMFIRRHQREIILDVTLVHTDNEIKDYYLKARKEGKQKALRVMLPSNPAARIAQQKVIDNFNYHFEQGNVSWLKTRVTHKPVHDEPEDGDEEEEWNMDGDDMELTEDGEIIIAVD